MKFADVLEIRNGKNQRQVENPHGKYPIYGSGGVMGYADDFLCDAETVIIGRKGNINNPIFDEATSSAKTGQQDTVGSLLTKGGMVDGIDSATARHEDEAKRNPNGSTAEKVDKSEFEGETTEYRLADIFDLQMGKTPSRNNPEYWTDGENKWISIADLTKADKYISDTKEFLTDKAIEESGITVIPADTVVMSFKLSIGKTAITREDMYSNEAIMSFRDKNVIELLSDYIYYLLLAQRWDQGANKAVMGMTQNKATLSERKVRIHTIESQKTIVQRLDKIKSIIGSRQLQLDQLDTLIKARFIEIFGNPLYNEKDWPCMVLTDVCRSIFGGGTPSKSHLEYFTGTIPWVSPKDMKSSIISDSIDHITEEAIKHSTTNLVPANSVLMVIRSGILKHTLPVAINSVPVTINQDMKAFVPNEKVTSSFLMNFFKAIETDVLARVRGVTADNIDFKTFQQRKIIIPPMELQEQFAAFVQQVDKSKSAIQKSLNELQTLFDSLMQEYFG